MDIEYKAFDSKPGLYSYINEQLQKITEETKDITAVLANASALLMMELKTVNWAGFYLYKNGRLILGPFQGKPAVAEIAVGAGVCGTAAETLEVQIVEDVHSCCNHIACDIATNSEIVVPILLADGTLYGVIDIDSPVPARFDSEDADGLSRAAEIISNAVKS
ncbi:MAG: GAF domain-containing protein [Eubacterium sp.]|nr:GAF domain-containing protein [Eubacterium sp.]